MSGQKKTKNVKTIELEKEECISCGVITPEYRSTNIYYRQYYIEGAGQLCKTCYGNTYGCS